MFVEHTITHGNCSICPTPKARIGENDDFAVFYWNLYFVHHAPGLPLGQTIFLTHHHLCGLINMIITSIFTSLTLCPSPIIKVPIGENDDFQYFAGFCPVHRPPGYSPMPKHFFDAQPPMGIDQYDHYEHFNFHNHMPQTHTQGASW